MWRLRHGRPRRGLASPAACLGAGDSSGSARWQPRCATMSSRWETVLARFYVTGPERSTLVRRQRRGLHRSADCPGGDSSALRRAVRRRPTSARRCRQLATADRGRSRGMAGCGAPGPAPPADDAHLAPAGTRHGRRGVLRPCRGLECMTVDSVIDLVRVRLRRVDATRAPRFQGLRA